MASATWRSSDSRPGIGAGGVDEAEDGQAELVRHFHQAQRLAVALGVGAAEVAFQIAFGVAALLRADDHDGFALEVGEAADDGPVVAEKAVAMEFGEAGGEHADVVAGVGTQRMAGHLDFLPSAHAGIDLFLRLGDFEFHALHLGGHVDLLVLAEGPEFGEFLLKFQDGFFKG
jgi:hypothetical protein